MFIHSPPDSFDPEEHFEDVPLHQGKFFRQWQSAYGRKTVLLSASDTGGKVRMFVQCVEYVFPLIGSVWYAARGPVGSCDSAESEAVFHRELRRVCLKQSPATSHIRLEREPAFGAVRTAYSEHDAGTFMQPPAERVVPLEGSVDDVVSGFAKRTKQIIRRYEQDHGTIRFAAEKINFLPHLGRFHRLLEETAVVKGFSLHPLPYYESLFSCLNANPEYGTLVTGYLGKEPVSTVLITYTAREAYHLFAGSAVSGYADNMPTLTLYHAMKEAKKQGAVRYNLGGVSVDRSGNLAALSVFKGKFGGETVVYDRPRDYTVSVWRYGLFRVMRLSFIAKFRRFAVRWYRLIARELSRED